ncbi:hypothetical protein [Billgrantia tianxiuensis]|uniref:hypothetical protein n=1 Tax=Billgrantia tianxiuensis TaxID=2497861 RepID=UPI001915CAC7|nr:hypothetical protein [Halomonas tianxiuensis]
MAQVLVATMAAALRKPRKKGSAERFGADGALVVGDGAGGSALASSSSSLARASRHRRRSARCR